MLIVKCQERLDKVRQWAKENKLEHQLNNKLRYLDEYGEGSMLVELYDDYAPQSFGFTMFRLSPTHEKGAAFMSGGLIYDEHNKRWGTHT